MKTCPACHNQNPDDAGVCESCGQRFDSKADWKETPLVGNDIGVFAPGDLIAGRYEVVKELGRGGMGVVYLVRDTRLHNREVALKMIHPRLVDNPEALQRFHQEVGICLDLFHQNIVRVHNLEEWQDLKFFTMEYVAGRSLGYLINKRKSQSPPFTLSEVVKVIDPLLDALSYAHQFTVYRDIKPENIIVTGKFPEVLIKVLDFGIAKTLSPSRFSQSAKAMGTPYYMAPEQRKGQKIDLRADLYSVGMVLYEMLTGEIAEGAFDPPRMLYSELPTEIDKLIFRLLKPNPQDRFADAAELKKALGQAVSVYEKAMAQRMEAKIKALSEKGQNALRARKWTEAESLFTKILESDPNNDQAKKSKQKAKENLAKFHKLLDRIDAAETAGDFEEGIKLVGEAFLIADDEKLLRQKEAEFNEALAEKKIVAKIHNNLADTYDNLDLIEKAITEYEKSIKADPSLATPYLSLRDIYTKLNKNKEAAYYYDESYLQKKI